LRRYSAKGGARRQGACIAASTTASKPYIYMPTTFRSLFFTGIPMRSHLQDRRLLFRIDRVRSLVSCSPHPTATHACCLHRASTKGLTWIANQILLLLSFEGTRDRFKITGISSVTCPPTEIGGKICHHLLVFLVSWSKSWSIVTACSDLKITN